MRRSLMASLMAVLTLGSSACTALVTPASAPAEPTGAMPSWQSASPTAAASRPAPDTSALAAVPRTTPVRGRATRITDVDGDGRPDIVWSDPSEAVAVAYGNGRVQSVDPASLGVTRGSDQLTAFGSDVAVGDLNRDGFSDVVAVDASGSVREKDVTAVWVLWGGEDGLSVRRAEVLATAPAWSGPVAVIAQPTPVVALSTREGRRGNGTVRLYPVRGDGRLGTYRLLGQDAAGLHGRIDKVATSNFGELLAASGDRLVIGDPAYLDTPTSAADGALWVLRLRAGLRFDAVKVTRAGLGLKRGTRFTESFVRSVSVLGDRVVVGSDQGWAGHESAGSVTTFTVEARAGELRVGGAAEFTKDSPGVPGTAGRTDLWGARVQAVELCDGVPGALVLGGADSGVDGEKETMYGTIVSVPFAQASTCPGQLLASGVDSGRAPLAVARTHPSGTPGELPVVSLANPLQLQVGWPGASSVLDLTGRAGVPGLVVLAAPAA